MTVNPCTILMIGGWEIIVIALVILLLIGGKKIPELMKGLGKGVKSFKDGINEADEDKKAEQTKKLSDGEGKKEE